MFVFSREQMEGFARYSLDNFKEALLEELMTDYPLLFGNVSALLRRRMLEFGISKANSYGFTQKNTVAGFIHLMACISPDFDTHPYIAALLQQRDEDIQNKRFERIRKHPSENVWKEATENGDVTKWIPDNREAS